MIEIVHFSDPGCPWAWSASPHLSVLHWRYGDQLRWRLVMIGLREHVSEEAARTLVAHTRLFTLAESLGAVESLVELPAPMTHASVAGSTLAVSPALVRLSVGIEAVDDLRADLEAAFGASGS